MRCLPALLLGAAVGTAVAIALATRADRLTVGFSANGRIKWSVTRSPPEADAPTRAVHREQSPRVEDPARQHAP